MGERRKKTLEKWVHNVERVIDTPSTVENRRLKEDEPKRFVMASTSEFVSSQLLDRPYYYYCFYI